MELEFANSQPTNDFAEVPQTILERSIQRQNEKKYIHFSNLRILDFQ